MFTLYNGDCLQVMPTIPSGSIDAIITDLPYGTTACEWDSVIPLAPMWEQVKRVLKPNGVFVTTASQPFTSVLVCSNLEWFKYEWIWQKDRPTNIFFKEVQPMKYHENILVFSSAGSHNMSVVKAVYNPQMEIKPKENKRKNRERTFVNNGIFGNRVFEYKSKRGEQDDTYPNSIQFFNRKQNGEHPTQKPLDLYRYLIRTYTNEGETVLDICMGSGTTIEAAEIEGRNSIGIEKDIGYFQVAEKRAKSAVLQQRLFTPSNNLLHMDAGNSPAQQEIPFA